MHPPQHSIHFTPTQTAPQIAPIIPAFHSHNPTPTALHIPPPPPTVNTPTPGPWALPYSTLPLQHEQRRLLPHGRSPPPSPTVPPTPPQTQTQEPSGNNHLQDDIPIIHTALTGPSFGSSPPYGQNPPQPQYPTVRAPLLPSPPHRVSSLVPSNVN